MCRKGLVLGLFLIVFISVSLPYRAGSAHVDDTVDILLVADEEIMPGVGKPWLEDTLTNVEFRFRGLLGIEIDFRGWVSWDSNDDEYWSFYLLDEAVNETGWYRGMVYDNVVMDILLVCTRQDTSHLGWADPDSDAVIVRFLVIMDIDIATIMHEISHLYLGPVHCDHAFCVMNPTYASMGTVDGWMSTCYDQMIANKDKYTRDITPVGGFQTPVNKFELLAPYIVVSVVASVVSVVLFKRRKKES